MTAVHLIQEITMADRSKFEKMLELLVNENKEAAEELFHEIVVEKSREIYESLLEEEQEDEDIDEAADEDDDDVEESSEDDLDESDDDLEEGFDLDTFEVAPDFMGGDATDDFENDVDASQDDDMGDMDGMDDMEDGSDDADLKSEVMDIKDALEELIAKFDSMMDHEEGEMDDDEGEMDDDEGDMDFGADDEEGDEEEDMPSKEAFTYEAKKPMKKDEKKDEKKPAKKTAGEEMREYVEKIGGAQYNQFGKMGDNGTNTKSIVAGKNDMGGTTANILRTDTEQGTEANKGQIKGSSLIKQSPQAMNTKNVNVPGSKTATKLSSVAKGHGAEKKGAGETADKSAGSMLNGAPKRAK